MKYLFSNDFDTQTAAFLGPQRPRPLVYHRVRAEVGIPPDTSSLTLGVEYSLVSVAFLIWGGAHYVTQFRLKGKWLKDDCTSIVVGVALVALLHTRILARLPRSIVYGIP